MTTAARATRCFNVGAFCLLALMAKPLFACAVCFGNPESDMVKGAKAGVLVMLVVVYAVVLTMVSIAGCWFVRARRLAAAKADPSSQDR